MIRTRRLLPLFGALLVAVPAAAQTTHPVVVGNNWFQPNDLTIQPGDTVRWDWMAGSHNVESGVGGVPDGIFNSGIHGPGFSWSLTFDQAFLDQNPVPGGVYDYYCILHLSSSGQSGKVRVVIPSSVVPYGCGVNPAGSLVPIAGEPAVGKSWRLGVTNPLGTQSAGALAFLVFSTNPAPGFPCGLPLPGFGMAGGGAAGELLVEVTAPDPALLLGPTPWSGTSPAPFLVSVPPAPVLAGVRTYVQGLLFDASAGSTATFALTDALEATIGS